MRISDLGEFGVIEKIKKLFKTDASVIRGPGDDCAVVSFDKEHYLLLTCDMLVEDVDFTRKTKPYLIGRKALAVSLSDIAACAGWPRYALVSLGLPKDSSFELVHGICQGLRDLAKKYEVNIVGGDLSRAEKISIDLSVCGVVEKKHLVLRSGARPQDVIFVTGSLGGSLRGKHLKFFPRLKEARFLVENFKVQAMIDVSDGLAQDLSQITSQSRVGAIIYEQLIPLSRQARGLSDALFSGEDFELLFTLSAAEAKRLVKKKLSLFHPIGEIVSGSFGLRLIKRNGRKLELRPKGFCHF
jgi:thiamine-monophosphate kinase